MAFTKSPLENTYKTVPLEFDGSSNYRSGDLSVQQDMNLVNVFFEQIKQENIKQRAVSVIKRPGLTTTTYNLSKSGSGADELRGWFYDVDQNAFYWAVNNKVHYLKPDSGTSVSHIQTIASGGGQVGFCSFLKSDNTRYVVFSDGVSLYQHDYVGGTVTTCVDADLPSPHVPFPVYIDGYILLIKSNTGDMYNSDLDNPMGWTAGNFISAEISSDYSLRIVKAKNYVIILGYNSIEYFYDAGNASGSPFSRNDSPFRGVGYVTGLCTIGDTTFFVGQDDKQGLGVYSINSFKVERVSNPVIDRTLQVFSSTQNAKGQVLLDKEGFCMTAMGHVFYVLVTPQTTWVYDIDSKFWYEWKGTDGDGLQIEAVWQMYNGNVYAAIAGQTYISLFSQNVYQDFGTNFRCRYTTEPFDADTNHWKTLSRLYLDTDQNHPTAVSLATVTWSDQDFADGGSGATRTVNVFSQNAFCYNLGRFRQRTFRIDYEDNYPLRLRRLLLDINIGTH